MKIQCDSDTIDQLLVWVERILSFFSTGSAQEKEVRDLVIRMRKEWEAGLVEAKAAMEGAALAKDWGDTTRPCRFSKLDMGHRVRCKITGFTGTIVGFAEFLDGRKQACLLPKCGEDGEFPEREWIDVNNLQLLGTEDKPLGFGEGSK